MPLDDETWQVDTRRLPSVLDRAIDLPFAGGRWALASIAIVAATLLRLVGLDRWPLSASGGDSALSAWWIVRGENVSDDLHGVAATVQWAALAIFVGGANDAIVRVAFGLAGIATVLLWLAFHRRLGWDISAAALVLAAFSPTMIVAARNVDGAALAGLGTLVILFAVIWSGNSQSLGWAVLAGVASALMILSDPYGIVLVGLAWPGAVLIARALDRRPHTWATLAAPSVAAGAATIILTTTVLLTRPGSFTASLAALGRAFWNDHIAEVGTQWHMTAFNLLLNEPLLVVLAIVAVVTSRATPLTRSTSIWALSAFVASTLLGGNNLTAWVGVVIPLTLLAAIGAAHLRARLPWRSLREGPGTLYVAAATLMLAALLSLFGLLTSGTGGNAADWLLRFVLVALVAVVPLAFALSAIGRRVTGDRLVLAFLIGLVLLGGLTIRSSVLAASERPGEPGDPLAAHALSADIPIVVGRLQRLSRDMTLNQRDSADPTGGHGLRIAIDSRIEQPFAWYFRQYPNLTIFDPDSGAAPSDAQIVIIDSSRDASLVAPSMRGQDYIYGHDLAPMFAAPEWSNLLSGIVNPDEWRRFAAFIIDRNLDRQPEAQQFTVLAEPDIANRLFQATGPFNLSDRVGAGSAEGQLNSPRGVAISSDGTIVVVDSRNGRVQEYASDGSFIRTFGTSGAGEGQLGINSAAGAGGPNGVAIDADGSIYVADTWNHRISVFSADGTPLRTWGQFADLQDSTDAQQMTGMFYGPRGIAIHDGLVYVTDTGNERVEVFETDGTFVRAFGGTGSGDGQLLEPVGIAVGKDGTVFVADAHNGRIARFSSDGTWLGAWAVAQWKDQLYFEPWIAVSDDGNVYVTMSTLGVIVPFDADGNAGDPLGVGQVRRPYGIAVTTGGVALLVADGALQTVLTVPLPLQ
ncbi:MAG: 6-bladed beta-propeller [Thermomicrobiales bacterium]|nr:6-bladed beta-propeller [Thermomicrobiales bacterium]